MKRSLLAGASKGNEMLWPQQEASVHSKSSSVIPDLKCGNETAKSGDRDAASSGRDGSVGGATAGAARTANVCVVVPLGSRSVNVGATAERVSEAHARVALPVRTRAEVPSSSCSSNGSGERAVRAGSDSGDRDGARASGGDEEAACARRWRCKSRQRKQRRRRRKGRSRKQRRRR